MANKTNLHLRTTPMGKFEGSVEGNIGNFVFIREKDGTVVVEKFMKDSGWREVITFEPEIIQHLRTFLATTPK